MPQIWLTYEELSGLLDCDAPTVREETIQRGWDRRRCHDGLTRVKLVPALAREFILDYARQILDQGVETPPLAQARSRA